MTFRDGVTGTGSASSAAATLPGTIASGDSMVLVVAFKGPSGSSSIDTPSGWTLKATVGLTGATGQAALFIRTADGTDAGSTLTVTGTGASQQLNWALAAYYGVGPFAGFTFADLGTTASASVACSDPGASTGYGIVAVAAVRGASNGAVTFTAPGGSTLREQQSSTSGVAQDTAVAVADTTTPGSLTLTASKTVWAIAGQVTYSPPGTDVAVGMVVETDTVHALTLSLDAPLGHLTETDTLHAIVNPVLQPLGHLVETDTPHAIAPALDVPLGHISLTRPAPVAASLTGNRSSRVRVQLLTATEAPAGTLAGVTGGSVVYTSAKSVHGSASLSVVDNGQAVDWLTARVRPIITIDGIGDTALGVFLVSEAPEDWSGTGRVWSVKLLDKTTILDQDAVSSTYALDAGSVVTDEVVALIESTGETNIAVTPSAATLVNPLVWPAGTTKLQIVNDLLSTINYFSLYCNGDGQYRGEAYVKPATRPSVWDFLDGSDCIYLPGLTKDVDLFAIPNEVVAITQGSGATAALTSTATNADPASPYSTVSRGRTISYVASGVEAADQDTLDAYAERRLIELTTPTASIDIQHAYVPAIAFNRAVRFRRTPAGIDARHVVSKTETSLDPTALVKTSLTEVVDI